MLKRSIISTQRLLDRGFKNGTVMVVIISLCITFTGVLHGGVNASLTADILHSQKSNVSEQYVIIDGKKYKIFLEEVK